MRTGREKRRERVRVADLRGENRGEKEWNMAASEVCTVRDGGKNELPFGGREAIKKGEGVFFTGENATT